MEPSDQLAPSSPPEVAGTEPPDLLQFTVDSLAQLTADLDAAGADDTDLVLALPAGAVVVAEPAELIDAARLSGGICVAASPVALASPALAHQVEQAVAEVAGHPVRRCHPYPHALVAPAGQMRSLLADLADGGSDADRLTAAVLSGRHDIGLDTSSQFFHVLDGTGNDVVILAGRAHAGDEQPLVLVDPTQDHGRLGAMTAEPVDGEGGGVGDQLADNGAVAPYGVICVAGGEEDATSLVQPRPADGRGLLQFTVDSLAQLTADLDAAGADDTDLVLALPAGAVVVAEPAELIDAARLSGGICVAASPVALASRRIARRVEQAVSQATGSPVRRCHPYPSALVGPAGGLRSLLADLGDQGSDADRLTDAVLSGRHDVVLDTSSQYFHVLDGTGTDVVLIGGRIHAGDEQPLVLIDPSPDRRALAMIAPHQADRGAGDPGRRSDDDSARVEVPGPRPSSTHEPFGPSVAPAATDSAVERPSNRDRDTLDDAAQPRPRMPLHRLAVDSLSQLAAELDAVGAHDTDVVVVVPSGGTIVLADPDDLIEAAQLSGGICVAASPVPLASPALAKQVERAVSDATGKAVLRCHPHPYGLLGAAGPLRAMLAERSKDNSDADWLTATLLSGRHDLILDTSSQFFHVLDGTGTDVVLVAGRAHAGEGRPFVLIDLDPDGRALALITADPVNGSARDLGRLLRYDGAIAHGGRVTAAAPDVLVTPLWTPEFCATVIGAAEAAALWVSLTDEPSAIVGTWLNDLVPRLLALLEADIDNRIWPLLQTEWPSVVPTEVHGALIMRYQAGGPVDDSVGHHDLAQLSGSIRLNDGYHGGALVLPRQGWDDSAVAVGALAVWPSLVTHPSETVSVTSGVKYRLALSWRLPEALCGPQS